MDEQLIIPILTMLSEKYADTAETLEKDFPHWDTKRDERILIFVKCANVLSSIKMGLIYSRDYLSDREWWNNYPEFQKTIDFHPNRAIEFQILMKASLAVFIFSIQEAALRCFLKAIDPTRIDLASGNFGNVYPFLLRQVYGSDQKREKYEELLRFWSLIRNSVHNNFVFSHQSGVNQNCKFRDQEYIFEIDRPVHFLTWDLFLLVTAELGDMMTNLVYTGVLSSLSIVTTPADMYLYSGSTNDE